jgi:(R,R)-butanediol dehydrogenase / meso-butanediol dehydrogenase / diacetyl reductase
MKAIRFYGKEDVRLDDVEEPKTRPGTVTIRPAWNGICGSDLHLFREGPLPPAPTTEQPHPLSGETLPVVLGHEFSGTAEEVGDDVTDVKVGDAVVVEPLMVDDDCPACRSGRYNLCKNLGFIGISGRGGGLSEHVVVEKRWVHPVGDLPLDQAAMIEPLAVSLHGVRLSGAREGDIAVVGGAGPIGLLTAAVLKAFGVRVIVSEIASARKEKAVSTGVADMVVDPTSDDVAAIVDRETARAGADVAFDCAGVEPVFRQLLGLLRPGGRLEVVAIHNKAVQFDLSTDLVMREISVGGTIGYANDHAAAIELASSGKVNLAPFITSRIGAEDVVEKGFNRLIEKNNSEVKILVHV